MIYCNNITSRRINLNGLQKIFTSSSCWLCKSGWSPSSIKIYWDMFLWSRSCLNKCKQSWFEWKINNFRQNNLKVERNGEINYNYIVACSCVLNDIDDINITGDINIFKSGFINVTHIEIITLYCKTSVGKNAFSSCSKQSFVEFKQKLFAIEEHSFDIFINGDFHANMSNHWFIIIWRLSAIVDILDKTSIRSNSFANCPSLSRVIYFNNDTLEAEENLFSNSKMS